MQKGDKQDTRKRYARPQLRSLTLEFGVYGDYGGGGGGDCDGGRRGGHHGGHHGGWWWW